MGIRYQKNTITELRWLLSRSPINELNHDKEDLIILSLDHYFETTEFLDKLDLLPVGTSFQLMVWKRLRQIPVGETITYGELARELQTSSRAIGQACRTNPLVIFIPCHRVVSKIGSGGYIGDQKKILIKLWLLEHEANH